jgi:hypothetical protein
MRMNFSQMPPTLTLESPVTLEDILNKGLADAVSCLFSESSTIPYSNIAMTWIPQDVQPIPPKWHTEVAIDDEAVFFEAREEQEGDIHGRRDSDGETDVEDWNGKKVFERAVVRLGLSVSRVNRLIDSDEDVRTLYGSSVVDLSKAKKAIKNELKEYDNAFKLAKGHEPSRMDKEPMRQLYTLYRKIREMMVKIEASSSVPAPSPQIVQPRVDRERAALEDRLDALYADKQSLRNVLNEYQTKFMQEQGRRIKYHRDIVAIDREYRQYKQVKEEIAKLESHLGRTPPTRKQGSGSDFFI